MIVVTGTQRSGTSMWMQILVAAGFPFIGERFPLHWQDGLRASNPSGFYESRLRTGIYGDNDRDNRTGKPLDADALSRHAVKIFVPGLVRTDVRHLHRVIGSVRDFREHHESSLRMQRMECAAMQRRRPGELPMPRMEPAYEWWAANYGLLTDARRRGYACKLVAYDTMVEHPDRTIRDALTWIGAGDPDSALAAVKPEHRTQRESMTPPCIEPEIADAFDELYERVRQGRPFGRVVMSGIEAVNRTLMPRIVQDRYRVHQEMEQRRLSASRPDVLAGQQLGKE